MRSSGLFSIPLLLLALGSLAPAVPGQIALAQSTNVPTAVADEQRPAARTFFVFFDSGGTELDEIAHEEVRAAAALAAQAVDSYRVHITGHADAVGSIRFNLDLSRQRAEVVREALLTLGLDAAAITTEAFGSGCPLVSRAHASSEPLNRRAEIMVWDNVDSAVETECSAIKDT